VVHKAAHKTTKKTSEEAALSPPHSTRWVLRAAMPGQAWVSTTPTSRELKQLQVGDTLEGIGKITAIQQQGNNWVVQGTKGLIQ
jgi:hypothetical protein